MLRAPFLLVLALTVALAGAHAARADDDSEPVPSLEPEATQALWQELVRRRRHGPPAPATDACKPLRAVFYAANDWMRLTTKLAAAASPCAHYYISVPPLAADKTQPRADQAWRIRALGPSFHALAEISWNGWSGWVATTGSSWFDAGAEARRRMAAAGYDVALGDNWALNELSSAVRTGTGSARINAREFIRGLYSGDGSLPTARGVVFTAGIGQPTADLSVYQARLQDWFEDASFWSEMAAYAGDWSQEVYGDVRNYAVPGASLAERSDGLNEYLQHEALLARAAPPAASEARAYLDQSHSPLANAAWQYDAAFGWTFVAADLMKHYVSAQAYAMRRFGVAGGLDRFGFAWAPKNGSAMPSGDFTAQSGAILDRLAAALRDSATDPAGACAGGWCAGDLDGASLNRGWASFATWKPSQLAFGTGPTTVAIGTPTPMTVELRTFSGTSLSATSPLAVSLTSSSPSGRFASTAGGPWTGTLTVELAAGATSAGFHYRGSAAGTAVVTAAALGKQSGTRTLRVVGDGRMDVAVWRPSTGVWQPWGQEWVHWGASEDVPVPADYDGDGVADVAVWRPSTGVWLLRGLEWVHWGGSGDVPVPADYDGDGDAEVAAWRPSTGVWQIRGLDWVQLGAQGDVPVPADYDGDGDVDIALWRPSTGVWLIRGQAWVQFGAAGDVPVPADFDGDGDVDIALWRPSTGVWLIRGQAWVQFGQAGDVPVPADFDEDGDAEIALWRPSTGVWQIRGQSWVRHGEAGDVLLRVPAARRLTAGL